MIERNYPERDVASLAFEYDMVHAVNVNLARMSTDLIDGLKNVQRRILYVMYKNGNHTKYRKLSNIDGDVFGKAHPHSPDAIYGAIVKMAQPWRNLIPFIDGSGNFGTIAGDVSGADRYISARLSEFAYDCFFSEFEDANVYMEAPYDESTNFPRPLALPAKYPVVLLNGSKGIGIGASTDVPAFNFREIIDATITLMKNPNARITLIPESTSYASIVESDFGRMCESSRGSYTERCTYEIDDVNNIIIFTSLPENVESRDVTTKLSSLMETNMPEIISVDDESKERIRIVVGVRHDVNPYKLLKRLISKDLVPGLEANVTWKLSITYERKTIDYSITDLLASWINWRREQANVIIMKRRSRLMAMYRYNEVKIFILRPENLNETVNLYRASNREDIESKLIKKYGNSEIRMDSYLAHSLSGLRMYELTKDSYQECLDLRERLKKELAELEEINNTENGIDKYIIAQLREGAKKYGTPRRSNVVPKKISVTNEVEGTCILQLSSNGTILRKLATNVDMEPVPSDSDGFACMVDNDSSFILINEFGNHSFIRVKDIPLDTELPVMRFAKFSLPGQIIGMLPINFDQTNHCILISKHGMIKRINIRDIMPSKKPLITLEPGDSLNRGIVITAKSSKEILIYTKNGMGQRLHPGSIRLTLPTAKGGTGFKLDPNDEIIGCFAVSPEKDYLLYTTQNGKMRLNNNSYLPSRKSKHDEMVQLISLGRDKLISVIGCNKHDIARVFFNDGTSEDIEIKYIPESTMSSPPVKQTKKNSVSFNVIKVRII